MRSNLEEEAKAFHKRKLRIFPSEMPSTWQMTYIIAKYFYNLAIEDIKAEIEYMKR